MKLDEKSLTILERFGLEYVNPHEIYQKYFHEDISRATFYRRLEILKQAELIEWRVGKVRITQKGLSLIKFVNSEESSQIDERADDDQDHVVHMSNSGRDDGTQEGLKHPFRVYDASKLKDKIDDSFIYVDYPQTSFILKILLDLAGIDEKGLRTNVQKFKAIKESDLTVKLAINYFEDSPKALLTFLSELIQHGRIKALFVGVKNERRALGNKKLIEFLHEFDFENERFKLPKDSITLFPLFLILIIGMILILAFRTGYEHATIVSVLTVVYFLRSTLFREVRDRI